MGAKDTVRLCPLVGYDIKFRVNCVPECHDKQAEISFEAGGKAERENHLRFIRKYIDNCGSIGDSYKVKGSHEILPQWLPLIALLDELTGGPEEW